jgi:hypothetical protein
VFGNIIITGPEDANGDLTSITKADANNIVSKITPIIIQGASNNDIAISPVIILD